MRSFTVKEILTKRVTTEQNPRQKFPGIIGFPGSNGFPGIIGFPGSYGSDSIALCPLLDHHARHKDSRHDELEAREARAAGGRKALRGEGGVHTNDTPTLSQIPAVPQIRAVQQVCTHKFI